MRDSCCNYWWTSVIKGGVGNLYAFVDNWQNTGPLGDYCYKKEYDHTLKENSDIYNEGRGKIGISYRGHEPVWIAPQDCEDVETNAFENITGEGSFVLGRRR